MNVVRFLPNQRGRSRRCRSCTVTVYGLQLTAYSPDENEIRVVEGALTADRLRLVYDPQGTPW
jgi:hypothetical protein